MTGVDLLRPSRDGDQFHYRWAARQALQLLRPGSELTAISVEGASSGDPDLGEGEEVIDLAEYYGGKSLTQAHRIVYRQLKHSTRHAEDEFTVSGLRRTLEGFGKIYREVKAEHPGEEEKVWFEFVSNRTVRPSVLQAVEVLASGWPADPQDHDARHLRQYAGFTDDRHEESLFFQRFSVDSSAPGLLRLDSLFQVEVSSFLPEGSGVEHVLLKEMIERRATSLELDTLVTRATVLMTLRTSEGELLPCPSLIECPDHFIVTSQAEATVARIVEITGRPVIVHAAGGIGKSVLTTRIQQGLPAGSLAVIFDCFGNGDYRRTSQPRHLHKKGLLHLANELATHTLCDPLIPVKAAQPDDYSRAFLARLRTSAAALDARTPGALLAIVVDAADNAALVADDIGDRTFVWDILLEAMPENVRLVMLCRTERIELLKPPAGTPRLQLTGFTLAETHRYLDTVFDVVSEPQADEFHRRTGGNPRIQAFAVETSLTSEPRDLNSCLLALGEPRPGLTANLDDLLQNRLDDCKNAHPGSGAEIDRLCEALSGLRPRIPVRVLSALCGVSEDAVHSFVADLRRPLLIDGDAVQFRDEPTETWFRTNYRPTGHALQEYVDRLIPWSSADAYLAVSLPELLWEAERVDTLVDLALTDGALPEGNDLERREIAQQRLQYALKAALRTGREFEAARLALKAGTATAGRSRTVRLLRHNTDLAGRLLDPTVIEDLVATRSLSAGWPGSNLLHEGALLSVALGQSGLAWSRLGSAVDWIREWSRGQSSEHHLNAEDIAEVAFGLLHAKGVKACQAFLGSWRPNFVAFEAGLIVATRLVDAGDIEALMHLATTTRKLKYLQYAVAVAAWHANIVCSPEVASTLVKTLRRQRRRVDFKRSKFRTGNDEQHEICAVTWIIIMGLRHGVLVPADAERLLLRNLPKDLGQGAGSDYSSLIDPLLCGFALLAAIRREHFDIQVVAGPDVVEARATPHSHSRALDEFTANVVPLAPWASVWIEAFLGGDTGSRLANLTETELRSYSDDRTPHTLIGGIARLGAKTIVLRSSGASRSQFLEWFRSNDRHLRYATRIAVVRATSACPDTEDIAFSVAEQTANTLETTAIEAESASDFLVRLARAVYRLSPQEALAYFTKAMDITSRVGDDAYARWQMLLGLAEASSSSDQSDRRRAYRVGQLVEGLEPYLNGIDEAGALAAILKLSGTEAVAMASRWRDRRFISEWAFVRTLTASDAHSLLDPVAALSLLAFESDVDELGLLTRALEHSGGHRKLLGVMSQFLRNRKFGANAHAGLDEAAARLNIDLSGTSFCHSARLIEEPESRSYTSALWDSPDDEDAEHHRQELRQQALRTLADCDLTTVAGWESARNLLYRPARLEMTDLTDHAARVPLSRRADMIAAFVANPRFSAFEYQPMITMLAGFNVMPHAARAQVRALADHVAKRFAVELTSRSYDLLSIDELARLTQSDPDLIGAAFRNLGSAPTDLKVEEYFALATRLARRLPAAQAGIVLDDLCNEMTPVAPYDSGDGLFENVAAAPASMSVCLAGHLWALLGAPAAAMRWRAAHSVRLLIELGCADEVAALNSLATGELDTAPFVDSRLAFYDLHALQWLLVAAARAALDPATHPILKLLAPILKRVAFIDRPHAVIQASAAATLSALARSSTVDLSDDEAQALQQINRPTSVVRSSRQDRAELSRQ